MMRFLWFGKHKEISGVGDQEQWRICYKQGHLAVNGIDDWVCIRCWTGWITGLRFAIGEAMREEFRNASLDRKKSILIGFRHDDITGDHWMMGTVYELGRSAFSPHVEIVPFAQALNRIKPTVPPSKGGPPYIFTLQAG